MATYLDRILAAHRAAAAERTTRSDPSRPAPGQRRGFTARILAATAEDELAVIAEIKRRSPSKGDLDAGLDAGEVAADYQGGGAACLSVLTDVEFFGGSVEDLTRARAATTLPVLRKDFTVCEDDVIDAAAMGADAVLLIVAALSDDELTRFHRLAGDLDLDALVEVHDEAELERALGAGATLVGVNQRDLVTFQVDTDRALRMAAAMPAGVVTVAESGIGGPEDAAVLAEAGYHAILVGETLVRARDRAATVAALRAARPPRSAGAAGASRPAGAAGAPRHPTAPTR